MKWIKASDESPRAKGIVLIYYPPKDATAFDEEYLDIGSYDPDDNLFRTYDWGWECSGTLSEPVSISYWSYIKVPPGEDE